MYVATRAIFAELRYPCAYAKVTALVRGVYSLTRTKRRRVLWCAWWTGVPIEDPFRAPDAWSGGARDEDEARRDAFAAAGMDLEPIEGRWAGAWVRVRAGLPPFVVRVPKPQAIKVVPAGPHAILGVARGASDDEVKMAFRRAALIHHPDRGGEATAFIEVKKAYEKIMKRRGR